MFDTLEAIQSEIQLRSEESKRQHRILYFLNCEQISRIEALKAAVNSVIPKNNPSLCSLHLDVLIN